jgi:hypothetical protein
MVLKKIQGICLLVMYIALMCEKKTIICFFQFNFSPFPYTEVSRLIFYFEIIFL